MVKDSSSYNLVGVFRRKTVIKMNNDMKEYKASKKIRLFITNRPKLYRTLSSMWRFVNRGVVARIQYNLFFLKYDQEKKKIGHSPIWESIEIETLNRCNGECSFCPVNKKIDPREPKRMSDELFKKIIDELNQISYKGNIFLHSNNEPYLDVRIIDFMKYAKGRLPDAHLALYTNGTLLTLDKFKESMKYLDELYIDNYSDEGRWHDNIVEIRDYCNKENNYKNVTFSMRKQNEVLFSRGGNAPNKKNIKRQTLPCKLPFTQVVIRPSGELSLCCNDALGDFTLGDVNHESLIEIWNSEKYCNIRKILKKSRAGINMCSRCDTVLTTY